MRNWLLLLAAVPVVVGFFLIAVPVGLIALGIAIGAIAWLSE